MDLTKIKEIFSGKSKNTDIKIGGWVRAFRGNRFIELNDGSSQKNIQCVVNPETIDSEILKNISEEFIITDNTEITIETNPDDINKKKLDQSNTIVLSPGPGSPKDLSLIHI